MKPLGALTGILSWSESEYIPARSLAMALRTSVQGAAARKGPLLKPQPTRGAYQCLATDEGLRRLRGRVVTELSIPFLGVCPPSFLKQTVDVRLVMRKRIVPLEVCILS